MYRIFTKPLLNKGIITAPALIKTNKAMLGSYNLVHDYYQYYSSYVPNNHILVRLLYVLLNYLPGDYVYRRVNDDLNRIASGLGITTNDTPGHIHTTAFYTDSCAIVATTFMNYFDIVNWQDIRAVRTLTHPFCSMTPIIPVIGNHVAKTGLAAVGIDIPLLAYQFQQWNIYNQLKPELDRETNLQFISKYILANMIIEQTDTALRNQLVYIYKNVAVPEDIVEKRVPPVRVVNYDAEYYKAIRSVLLTINLAPKPYIYDLIQIPMAFADNYLAAVPSNITGLSVYSYWTTLLIYSEWLYPMTLFIDSDQKSITNLSFKLKQISFFINGSQTLKYMPKKVLDQFMPKYQSIQDKYG